MSKVEKSIPQPAKLANIIKDLFANLKIRNEDGSYEFTTFSRVELSDRQKKSLTYIDGFAPINVYLVQQDDKFDRLNNLISSTLKLVSLVKNGDGFIYGNYFKFLNRKRWSISKLTESPVPIKVPTSANIITENYLEAYNNVLGTSVILGLSTKDVPFASLQYSNKSKYYFEVLRNTGIVSPHSPKITVIGLSENLVNFDQTMNVCI